MDWKSDAAGLLHWQPLSISVHGRTFYKLRAVDPVCAAQLGAARNLSVAEALRSRHVWSKCALHITVPLSVLVCACHSIITTLIHTFRLATPHNCVPPC